MGDFDSSSTPYRAMMDDDCHADPSNEDQGAFVGGRGSWSGSTNSTNQWGDMADPTDMCEVDEGLHFTNRGEVHHIPDEPEGKWCHWPTLVAYVGPGFLVCIAYLDPGNLEADLQTGAYTAYQLLWVLLLAHIMGLVLQSLAARLGVVTGTHLADVCRMHYPRPMALMLWVMTESAIIGSDIQEVVGSAIGLQILFGIPLWAGCLLTALDTFTFLFIHVFGVRKLEALFVFLVSVMTAAFFVDFGMSPPTAAAIAEGFSFEAEPYTTVTALGLIGAVIMPHNIYLHSALVLSRMIDRSSPRKLWEAVKYYTIDSGIALFVAFLINLAVVCTFAKHFYDEACATASTPSACFQGDAIDWSQSTYGTCGADGEGQCQEIGLAAAADALKGTLGSSAKYVWAVGLLAAGQSSTMTGTYAGQFVMEGFLQLKIPKWQRVLVTRIIALGPALAVTVYMGGDVRATDRLSAWLNVLQSLQLPFAVIPLLTFCNSRKIMGDLAIKPFMTVLVWILALCIIGINLYIVGGFVVDEASNYPNGAGWIYALSGFAALFYLVFIAALVSQDLAWCRQRASDAFKKLGSHDVVEGYNILEDLSTSTTRSPEEEMNGGSGREGGDLEPLKSEGLEDAERLGGNGRAAAEGSGDGSEVLVKGAHRDVMSDSDSRV